MPRTNFEIQRRSIQARLPEEAQVERIFMHLHMLAILQGIPSFIFLCSIAFATAPVAANADELSDRVSLWESGALMCDARAAPGENISFPSKQTNKDEQPCDDGDMTLFNGLLCYAGDERGCIGVAAAQDPNTGQWFRSPRIRLHGNDRGGASFSPDMALGVQLYLIKRRTLPAAISG